MERGDGYEEEKHVEPDVPKGKPDQAELSESEAEDESFFAPSKLKKQHLTDYKKFELYCRLENENYYLPRFFKSAHAETLSGSYLRYCWNYKRAGLYKKSEVP